MQHVNRGVRVTTAQFERWQLLAKRAGINRNRLIGVLLENAEVVQPLTIQVSIGQQKSSVQVVKEGHTASVGAN